MQNLRMTLKCMREEFEEHTPTDTKKLDEDYDIEWSDFNLSKNNNEFKGSPDSMYSPKRYTNRGRFRKFI